MNAETEGDVERRARVHAALGDPARLRIVDALSLGDASSSELARLLAVPSNLLAHHLKVLERAGLVARTPSEGDRRRTYLRLLPTARQVLGPAGRLVAPRVLFVCTANSARSHLAAALWHRASAVPVGSAGTHPAARIAPGAVAAARRHGLSLRDARPRHLTEVLTGDELVVTVCDRAHEELVGRADVHWSVPDPVSAGAPADFDQALQQLAGRVQHLAARLVPA